MAEDILIRKQGCAGRITLNRPGALNALTLGMCAAIEEGLDAWAKDDEVALLLIDAAGDRAFCAGGDIQDIYAAGLAGDRSFGEAFWRLEYRMNAKLFRFPKPVVTFLQGLCLGGGVGVGCHGSHRIVDDDSHIALPEVTIGLVPDVGSSLLLALAPGRLGEYLGLTGDRMNASDAIHAGFADYLIPVAEWPALKDQLCATGELSLIDRIAQEPRPSRLKRWQPYIDAVFAGETLGDIYRAMPRTLPDALVHAQKLMARNSPLALWATVALVHRSRSTKTIEAALDYEFRFTSRAIAYGDFLEGIRAAVIDRDRAPKWRHAGWQKVTGADIVRMGYPTRPPLDLTGTAS